VFETAASRIETVRLRLEITVGVTSMGAIGALHAAGCELIDVVRIGAHAIAGRQTFTFPFRLARRVTGRRKIYKLRMKGFSTCTPACCRDLAGFDL
jgi:hypothetical protein